MHRLDGKFFPIDADVRRTGANSCTVDCSVMLIDVKRGRIDGDGSLTSSNGSTAHDNERRVDRSEIISSAGDPRSSDNARRTHRGSCEPHVKAAATDINEWLTGTNEWLTGTNEFTTSSSFAATRTNNVTRHRNVSGTRANISESHHNFSDTHANIFGAPHNPSSTHAGRPERHAWSAARPSIAGHPGRRKTLATAVKQ